MKHEDYVWYKEHGICTHCRKEKAEEGKTLCLACRMENRKYKKKKKHTLEYYREIYEKRKASGLCVGCGKRKQEHGLKCNLCWSKAKAIRARKQDIPRSERISYGLCYICGNPKLSDKGVCEECYQKRLDSVKRIMYIPGNKYWKKDNSLIFKQ